MNNYNEKEFLLNELREHTEDCDCARNQHFFDEKECRRKAKLFKKIQSSVFLITIATYVLIVSGIKQNFIINYIGIGLAMASTLLEILSHMLRYEDEAIDHWKSAQMYSELYRKCQFFYSNYMNASIDVWREKLADISEELSRISLLSPSVSKDSYNEWAKYGFEKKYPVHKAIYDLKTDRINEVIDSIKKELQGNKIEIFIFGSYLSNMFYHDIDIAVIIHEDVNRLQLEEQMNRIEQSYSILGVDLDISVITESDIVANRCTQFITNICNGECYYKSSNVSKSIKEYEGIMTNYVEMIDYFIDKIEKTTVDYASLVSNGFYYYYHALAALMSHEKIAWYGEKSLIINCEYFASNNDCKEKVGVTSNQIIGLLQHVRLFFDEKETLYLSREKEESKEEEKKNKLLNYIKEDKKIINQLKPYFS